MKNPKSSVIWFRRLFRAKIGAGNVELARLDDVARLVASLHAASWRNTYRDIFPQAYLDDEVATERLQHWRMRVIELANGSGEIFLASISRKPAGFLCIESGPGKEWGAFVDNLHVLPHLRGANIGARLLARGEDWALRHDHRQLYLWVFEENHAARRFYRREGWRDAERQLHVIPGGDSRPVRRMIKRP